jgi:hypothetical protein
MNALKHKAPVFGIDIQNAFYPKDVAALFLDQSIQPGGEPVTVYSASVSNRNRID